MTHTIYTIKARDKSRENYYAVDQHGNNNNFKKKVNAVQGYKKMDERRMKEGCSMCIFRGERGHFL